MVRPPVICCHYYCSQEFKALTDHLLLLSFQFYCEVSILFHRLSAGKITPNKSDTRSVALEQLSPLHLDHVYDDHDDQRGRKERNFRVCYLQGAFCLHLWPRLTLTGISAPSIFLSIHFLPIIMQAPSPTLSLDSASHNQHEEGYLGRCANTFCSFSATSDHRHITDCDHPPTAPLSIP